jgi:redox-sensitive bicupin YhaK (pirin superfamily)
LVVAKGAVAVNGETLGERDALQISNEASLVVVADADAEILLAVLS